MPAAPAELTAGDMENLGLPSPVRRGRWHGLPRHPAWLTWLGPAYAAATGHDQSRESSASPAMGHLIVQDENLAASSEVLLEGVDEGFYRLARGAERGASRERSTSGISFDDASWLP